MHKLLQQVGRQAIQRQEPWKRQVLTDTDEIRDVLENDSGSRNLMGVSFDISTIIDKMDISARAFKSMCNLRFLKVYNYNTRFDTNVRVHLPEDMEFPPRLRLLHWEEYPRKFLPRTFCPEHLVKLNLIDTELERLWEGTQLLTNLKKMSLGSCLYLKELPDLAKATNLEKLRLGRCKSLVEIHSSVGNLHKLQSLEVFFCKNLQVVPNLFNLASLESVMIMGCYQMRNLPVPTTITELSIPDTLLEEFTESIRLWSHLQILRIFGCAMRYQFMKQPYLGKLGLVRSDIGVERIPGCIKDLQRLEELIIIGCPKLASLPELPRSLTSLTVYKCDSLETLAPFPLGSEIEEVSFPDCFKLGRKARRLITQLQSSRVCLPGRNIPAEFHYRAIGNFLAICSNASRFKICVVVSPKQVRVKSERIELLCHIVINGCPMKSRYFGITSQSEHMFIFPSIMLKEDRQLEQYSEIMFKCSTTSQNFEIIECGVQILRDRRSCESKSGHLLEDDDESLYGSLDYDAPRVDTIKDFAKFLSSLFIFLLSLIPSVLFYSLLKEHKDLISDYFTSFFSL